ncbi:hypothetical protein ABZ814_22000 [Micromonospora musae]|uniref:hypothetical protein n=1 Tax=Micromonospora musae TaxID=1894970 RepID=UPI0033C9DF4F
MSREAINLDALRIEIDRYDWCGLRSFMGDASMIPSAIEALAGAATPDAAQAAYWRIDNVAIIQGRLSQCVAPLTSCLLVALTLASDPARSRIFDLLATISGGYDDHVESSAVGPISVRECVGQMARHKRVFVDELTLRGNASCVDILLMCAIYDEALREDVIEAFRNALSSPESARIRDLIESSIAEIS